MSEERAELHLTLRKKQKCCIISFFPPHNPNCRDPRVLSANETVRKLSLCHGKESPHIFTLYFNKILALHGPCTGQDHFSACRVYIEV